MNALDRARHAMAALPALLHRTAQARQQAQQRIAIKPRATQLQATGSGMVRIVDADTGKVLGFRETIKEARWLQQALENGTAQQA
ncbi:hypothetical protein HP436_00325 [Pseudomonas sp. CrR14]|nr:hypothetical protein [Pseudomonas sp. CrR14]